MNPIDKAKELIIMMQFSKPPLQFDKAKQCAKICVDEILKALTCYDSNTEEYIKEEFGKDYFSAEVQNMDSDFRYWDKVKNEIDIL